MQHRRRLVVICKLFFLKWGTYTLLDLAPTSPQPHTWPLWKRTPWSWFNRRP